MALTSGTELGSYEIQSPLGAGGHQSDPTRIIFVKDQAGKVAGMVVHIPDREVQR